MSEETQGQTIPADENQKVVEEETSEKTEQAKAISDIAGVEKNDTEGIKEKKRSSVFSDMLSYKRKSKESEKLLKEKEEELEKLRSGKETGDLNVDSFAEKWDVPKEFVEELAGFKKSQPKGANQNDDLLEVRDEIKSFREERQSEERQKKLDNAIEKEFSRVISSNPDYKEFVNKEAIKNYAKLNINKSMEQIIFDLYGNLINSKNKNIEDYSASGKGYGKEINFNNPTEEEAQAIKKSSKLSEDYGKNLVERLKKMNN